MPKLQGRVIRKILIKIFIVDGVNIKINLLTVGYWFRLTVRDEINKGGRA